MVCETSFPTFALVRSSGQLKAAMGQYIGYCENIILSPEILFNDVIVYNNYNSIIYSDIMMNMSYVATIVLTS